MCTVDSNNITFYCLTGVGQCVNTSQVCDGFDHCTDGSDESFTHALCYGYRFTIVEVMAIVFVGVVSLALFCCLMSTTVDCVIHIHRYWCPFSPVKIDAHNQRSQPSASTQMDADIQRSSAEPLILLLKELPTNCSTIVVTCQPDSVSDSDSDSSSRRTVVRSVTMSGGRRTRRLAMFGSSRSSSSTCFRPAGVRPSNHCDLCNTASVAQLRSVPEDQLNQCCRDSLLYSDSIARSHATAAACLATNGIANFRMIIPTAPPPPPSYSSICVSSWYEVDKDCNSSPANIQQTSTSNV